MSERNESLEIYNCIREHGPIDVEAISEKTGYHPHLVELAIKIMLEYQMIYQSGVTPDRPPEWSEPVYMAKSR
jgi:predicted transcriptional regulator